MKAIKELTQDDDWGDPSQYDIVINRMGESLDTEYSVRTKPKKDMKKEIKEQYESMTIDLTALFRGADPYNANTTQDEVSQDDLVEI